MKNSWIIVAVTMSFFATMASVLASESADGGANLIAICDVHAAGGFAKNPTIMVYNLVDIHTQGADYKPWYHVVLVWETSSHLPGSTVFAPVKNYTVPSEEIHFDAPGFKLEVVTNLQAWSDGILPGTDKGHPEQTSAKVWTTIAGQILSDVPVDCEFKR